MSDKGLEVVLIHESYERSVKKVYRRSEQSWQLEDKRAMARSNIEAAGATLYKPNRAYQKDL